MNKNTNSRKKETDIVEIKKINRILKKKLNMVLVLSCKSDQFLPLYNKNQER